MRQLRWLAVIIALLGSAPVFAQARPTPDQLNKMMAAALQTESAPTKFSRPQIMGLTGVDVYTKGISLEEGDTTYWFAVTTPRLRDGLFFFIHKPSTKMFNMHRTDTHLRRVASARNFSGNLQVWAGSEADADMARQLSYWATHFRQ